VPKEYVAKLRGRLELKALEALRNGVVLDDGERTKPCDIYVLREEERCTWLSITLYEGRNRQIHRMGDAIAHPVLRLSRISFAGITTEGLRPGQMRELDIRELEKLKKAYVDPARKEPPKKTGKKAPDLRLARAAAKDD
jgi:23S rRNA pseudouridine2605 synthase